MHLARLLQVWRRRGRRAPLDLGRPVHRQRDQVHLLRQHVGQALDAQRAGASYVNIGPIFPTQTKTATAAPLGPDAISPIADELLIPYTTMGGIKLENIDEVLRQGAEHVAVVTAVTAAHDPRAAAEALRARMTEAVA